MNKEKLEANYRGILGSYLREKDEKALSEAIEFSKDLFDLGVSSEHVIQMHLDCQDEVLQGEDLCSSIERMTRADDLLLEIMKIYDRNGVDPHLKLLKLHRDYYGQLMGFLNSIKNRLNCTLDEMKDQSERINELNDLRSELVSMVAHELRTPLSSIKVFMDLIVAGELGPISDEAKKALSQSLTQVNRLTRLIGDFLDLAKIEARRISMNMEEIRDLDSLIKSSVSAVRGLADKHKISIEVGEVPQMEDPLMADRDKIEQVLINLLSNGVKFTPPGGKVSIEAMIHDGYLQISVRDTGVGIKEDEIHKVFGKFQKLSSRSFSEVKGSGLGLAISKAIVEAHKGKIWAESSEGIGSNFTFALPLTSHRPHLPPEDSSNLPKE